MMARSRRPLVARALATRCQQLSGKLANGRHAYDDRRGPETAPLEGYPPCANGGLSEAGSRCLLKNQARNSPSAMLYARFVIGEETLWRTSVFSFSHPAILNRDW